VRELRSDELGTAAAVLSRGMRDNPLHRQVFGADPERREAALRQLFTVLLMQYQAKGIVLGAFSPATLVGVCAMVHPGRCQPSLREKLALLGAVARGNRPATIVAALRWTSGWARQDPSASHWHLGPVGVERERQGQGIGTALLAAFGERMDANRAVAYLETDKQINVPFYERFGFKVRAEATVLGVPNWFMLRPAAA
jgi:ribosomal protein S18 acetylase RimI-like enzyme